MADSPQHDGLASAEVGLGGAEPDSAGLREHAAAPVELPQITVPAKAAKGAALITALPGDIATGEQRPPKLREVLPIGSVDRVSYEEISGWVWNSARPNEPVDIEILDDGVVVLKVGADKLRPDLVKAGAGSGHHGFFVQKSGRYLSAVPPSRARAARL